MVWALKKAEVPASDPIAHLVLIGLADHADDDGNGARPSVAKLAEYARCSPRSVHNKLRTLKDAGLIRRGDQRAVEHLRGDCRPVVWDLNVNGVNDFHDVHEVQAVDVDGVHATMSRGEQPGTDGVHASADRTVHEPSLNQGEGYVPDSPVRDDDRDPTPHEDLGGRPRTEPLPLARQDRCILHQLDDFPPPCRGCKTARETHEQAKRDAARAEVERERAARAEAARLQRLDIAQCRMCDETGYVNGRVCDHDPESGRRAARGAAAVRAALMGVKA